MVVVVVVVVVLVVTVGSVPFERATDGLEERIGARIRRASETERDIPSLLS